MRLWVLVALAGGCRVPASAAPADDTAARAPVHDASVDPRSADPSPPDPPSVDTPSVDTPSVDAPSVDTPSVDRPSADAPSTNAPSADPPSAFHRGSWASWIDADGDCQDTRAEVLVATSEIPVTFADRRSCTVATGRWRCPYTDRTITDPRTLDIDHLVPLAHAHDAGASHWNVDRFRSYANALGDPDHLVAVDRSANRSKGARTVTEWLPEEPGFRCQYVAAWRRIKKTWRLTEADDERTAIDDMLRICAKGDVPERPGKTKTKTTPAVDPPPSGGACCRVCKSGKPCGDACIAADRVCRKPPGCAC